MAITDYCCFTPDLLGSTAANCDTKTGIEKLYYTCFENIASITYAAAANENDLEAVVSAFSLQSLIDNSDLLNEIKFINLDDDTGALLEFENTVENGNKTNKITATIKARTSGSSEQESTLDKMLGKEIVLLAKYKNQTWKIAGLKGGFEAASNTGNSNQSWTEIIFSGNANERMKPVLDTFAATAFVPNTIDPTNGLLR